MLDRSDSGWDVITCHLPFLFYCMEEELNMLSRTFVSALRITTTNCRVSFIDFYWRISYRFYDRIFTPYTHCNRTRILLWYYHRAWDTCDTNKPIRTQGTEYLVLPKHMPAIEWEVMICDSFSSLIGSKGPVRYFSRMNYSPLYWETRQKLDC